MNHIGCENKSSPPALGDAVECLWALHVVGSVGRPVALQGSW